jgi:DNA-binding CsgD family transcriptional regulator
MSTISNLRMSSNESTRHGHCPNNSELTHNDDRLVSENDPLSDNLFQQWVSSDLPDRVLIDRQGKILWCRILNSILEHDDEDFVSLKRVHVGSILPSCFLNPILAAGAVAQNGQSRIALIERRDIRDNLIARVTPLGDPKSGPLGVTISSRQSLSDDARADLKRVWDISASESRVLSLTFQGLTVQEVSESTALSVETIRTHIRHIYTKLGVNSREALFATIGPLLS